MRNAEAHLTLAIIVARQGDTEQADSLGMQALQIDAARPSRHVAGDRWFVDETYLKVAGRWVYLYRAIDQHVQIIDVLPSEKRDLAATRRFFARRWVRRGDRPR
jgi:transposase-like protein